MPYPFFVILLFLSHFCLISNSLNINILHEKTLELKPQENDKIPRKFLFISLNSSTPEQKINNIPRKLRILMKTPIFFKIPTKQKMNQMKSRKLKTRFLGF